ncbi:hypothetical protein EIP91_007595 [Steccherinum ochraceum]|uniref:Uncharacterized protein n=1 Tax=Steccherinum ochraceum TaxID=92696 RepID=A0A4R0RUN4_9APHY|nr:hypothetical protein EIP91_007595 [Steccherinum ochraceum]
MAATQPTPAPFKTPSAPRNLVPLWTQLLQKNPPALNLGSISGAADRPLPPIAPLDKAGTSMRILLHDTQIQFEKFSERVVKLTGDVDDTKREITTMQKLFEREHESLVEEVVDLVGNPAQASRLDELHQKYSAMDARLTSLDGKVDALHMLNQTQSQALQTIQDQQCQLLAALTPVLPLLQTIPLHVENAKHDIKDFIFNTQKATSVDLQSQLSSVSTQLRENLVSTLSRPTPPPSVAPREATYSSSVSERCAPKRRKTDSGGLPLGSDSLSSTRASTPNRPLRSPRESRASSPRIQNASPARLDVPTTASSTALSMPLPQPPEPTPGPSLGPPADDTDSIAPPAQQENPSAVLSTSLPTMITPIQRSNSQVVRPLPAKPFSLKEMRAPLGNEGKRFLPIDDDEDEEDEMEM